ncbi:metallophosphoesterase [candidate division KSB1 bacterium]
MGRLFILFVYWAFQIYILYKIISLIKGLLDGRKRKYAFIILVVFYAWVHFFGFYLLIVGSFWRPPAEWIVKVFVYPFFGWLIVSVILIFLYLVIDIIRLFLFYGKKLIGYLRSLSSADSVPSKVEFNKDRRKFLQIVTAGLTAAPVLATGCSIIFNSRDFLITNIELNFPDLPENLRGLKLAQVSDFHCNEFSPKEVIAKAVGIINDADIDLVFITGDFVPRQAENIYPCMEAVRECRTRHGIFASIGNHDYWANARLITRVVEENGIPVFINCGKTLNIRGEKLNILGVDDMWVGNPNINAALDTVEKGHFNILMSHNPDYWETVKRYDIGLTFAGHTHGGQVGIDLFGIGFHAGEFFHEYNRGLFRDNGKVLYVNQGIGFTGPPIRLNTPPEITFVTLT